MPKYLLHGSYTTEGVRGLLKEGGSSRRAHFGENIKNLGGTVEAFYYAFGGDDAFAIVDLPDNVSGAAVSLALASGGGFRTSVVALLTPEEIDQSVRKAASVGYRLPGQSS
jgi:uncharacterized protein with GYD domain